MFTHWNQNLLLFGTTMLLMLMRLPIGNGIRYPSKPTPKPLEYEHTVEVLVAVDETMANFHKGATMSYIRNLFSVVSNIFLDASIGNSISISVVDVVFLGSKFASAGRKATSNKMRIHIFCDFISKEGYHYDTAMLITRDSVCHEIKMRCQMLGFAYVGSVCQRRSCSIVQDNGLGTVFTIAHELGHILNMPHDDEDPCERYRVPKAKTHLMSSFLSIDIHLWSWSNCSRYHISRFLTRDNVLCLKDTKPSNTYFRNSNSLPGENYSREQQCQLIPGNRPEFCRRKDECKQIYCRRANSTVCRSITTPVADGTPCNENRFWCQKGKCVPRLSRPVVHGDWGPWSEFTPCSLTCGGGVQESKRECNNPMPVNGRYCAGERKRYRSCNMQSCPVGSLEPRELLCSKKNGQDVGIEDIIDYRSAKWMPKYFRVGEDSDYQCLLHCHREGNNTHYRFQEIVPDGTACSVDSFDKCVNGNCKPAGCDNKLSSAAKLGKTDRPSLLGHVKDKCGVCGGRNETCVDYSGAFYVSDLYKIQPESQYRYVTTIPKGASNIFITTKRYANPVGSFIILVDDQNNYLLNGNEGIKTMANISYAGVLLNYLNPAPNPEYLKSTPSIKLKRALVIKAFPFSATYKDWSNDTLLLNYSYTMDKMDILNGIKANNETYRWQMREWSDCDSICQGNSHKEPVCANTTTGVEVAPELCDMNIKPSNITKPCNMECSLSLESRSTECSAACGNLGTRNRTYSCVKTLIDDRSKKEAVDLEHCWSEFGRQNRPTSIKCREGCWTYTEWSACSESCGAGYQTRKRMCVLDGNRVSDSVCNLKNVEVTERACNINRC